MNNESKEIISKIKDLEQELKEVELGSGRSSEILCREFPDLFLKAEIQAKKSLAEAKQICLNSRIYYLELTSKGDLETYWKINDCLTELEKMLESKQAFSDYRLYFFSRRIDSKGFNSNRGKKEGILVESLNKAGKLALDNYELDIEIRKVAKKDKENYLAIFKHIGNIKELLNIQPDEGENYENGIDYRHPGFGITYGRAEKLAKGGNE